MSIKERLITFAKLQEKSIRAFESKVGFSNGYINNISKSLGAEKLQKIICAYPSLNENWLMTGNGPMLKENLEESVKKIEKNIDALTVPLLPISAQGGRLDDFVTSVKQEDCEKLISPIQGADFAITVSGESMAPEYPSGSKILIKKINEKSFIEWGRCYVLDTCNGTVIKKLDAPTEPDPHCGMNYVTCISVNPDPIYKPFRVPTSDNYGIYRVLMMLTEK